MNDELLRKLSAVTEEEAAEYTIDAGQVSM